MRFFTQADQELIDAIKHDNTRLAERLVAANGIVAMFADANLRLSSEVVRLSERNTPVIPEGEIEQPASTRDTDHEEGITLNDPENLRRPKPGPARVDD